MKNYKKNLKILEDGHVYSKEMEHDACGVGLIASTEGKKSRKVVEYGKVTKWGTLKTNFDTMETNLPGVFAAGDIIRGASLVVWAIKDGRDVAVSIKNFLEIKELSKEKVA